MRIHDKIMPNLSRLSNGPKERKRTVCARCAKIKQACSGGFPCSRCKRLNVICQSNKDENIHDPANSDSNSTVVRITRNHNACLNCKRRRKKCDEKRPKCSDCRRLCLDCEYSSLPWKSKSSGSQALQDLPEAVTEDVEPSSDEVIIDIDDHLLGLTANSTDWDALTESWVSVSDAQLDQISVSTRSSFGSSSHIPTVMLSAAPDLTRDEDNSLLNHYINVVARALSKQDESQTNPYLSNILPLAFSNQAVMEAVLALSANHWKKLQPNIWKRGIFHQTNGKF